MEAEAGHGICFGVLVSAILVFRSVFFCRDV